ncbi:LINE-1 retrotransposable element ORF2 protein [Merluccius polli]|uniref:LINE-1 retrotransposable element ORF2 protein n=1 Tax=Merluccius polli TaxID=89951 RepID=A0AA47NU87_MERPO|nr:LINE-1 retrotransposable element ORF2 protein [Merluccius polli]
MKVFPPGRCGTSQQRPRSGALQPQRYLYVALSCRNVELCIHTSNLETSSDYCERAVGIQGRLEDIQERLDDCRKVCIGGGKTRGTQSQVANHSAEGSNVAEGRQTEGAGGPSVDTYSSEGGTDENTPRSPTNPRTPTNPNNQEPGRRTERKEPGRRQLVKWPKANEVAVWQQLDKYLCVILERSLRGPVETKLNCIGDILYEECRGRFGVVPGKQSAGPKRKGRREREIEQLVMRRRQLRKQWRKASNEEKKGLKPLWEEAKKTLASLRRAERIRKRRRQKEERSCFFKNPFKHARRLLEDKRSGKLDITQSELENHIREQYSDSVRSTPLGSPAPPSFLFDAALPKLSKVAEVVRKARTASAPGPNGIPHKLYKYCPGVLKHLWNRLRVAWKNQVIPSEWQRAVTVLIPKEANSTTISQFRSIALLNVKGKIFFSILAKRLTNYLTSNGYIDTSCQKAAFEIILIGARKMVGGVKLPSGQRLPPVRGYMDDITTILQTAACTTRLLKRIDELVGWARMKIKPSKSRSLSLRKGVRSDHTTFVAGGEEIPLLASQPIRSLGRTYTADLSDRQMAETVRKQLADGLARINQSQLPGKYKVWSYQFILYPRVMWPLKMSDVPSSVVDKMDGLANSSIRKWLGLPRCLSDVGLFSRNMLQPREERDPPLLVKGLQRRAESHGGGRSDKDRAGAP